MKEQKTRKSKGSFSVLDEFTSDSGVGEIEFTPKAAPDVLKKIEEATRLADIPVSSRASKDSERTDNKEIIAPVRQALDSRELGVSSPLEEQGKKLKDLQPKPPYKEETRNNELIKDKQSPTEEITIGYQTGNKRITVKKETRDKLETNWGQTEDKTRDKLETNWGQTRDKSVETGDKLGTQLETKLETNRRQTRDKLETNLSFSSLTGLQRTLMIFLYLSCKAARSSRTEQLSIEHIAQSCEARVNSTKKTLQRLEQKGFLHRAIFKAGRGGWTVYEVEKEVFQDLLRTETEDKLETNWRQTRDKLGTQLGTQLETKSPYSSSINLNINTNTTELPENLRRFGISVVNLQNLVSSGKTTQEVIDRSLAALSYDVENGKAGNLANILFGVLNTGREYISQKYSESLQKELDEELARIQQTEESQKKLDEARLQMRFREFLSENPTFLEKIQERNKGFIQNQELLEKMAFEEFKAKGPEL